MRTSLLIPLFALAIANIARADCFSQYSHRACGPDQNYTCKQKALDVKACQEIERRKESERIKALDKQRASKESSERAAIEAINRANKTVHKQGTDSAPKNKNATPSKLDSGTTF